MGLLFLACFFSTYHCNNYLSRELSVDLMFFWLNGPWLFSGHQLFPAGHQSQSNALCLHYYCLSRWHFWCNHCLPNDITANRFFSLLSILSGPQRQLVWECCGCWLWIPLTILGVSFVHSDWKTQWGECKWLARNRHKLSAPMHHWSISWVIPECFSPKTFSQKEPFSNKMWDRCFGSVNVHHLANVDISLLTPQKMFQQLHCGYPHFLTNDILWQTFKRNK